MGQGFTEGTDQSCLYPSWQSLDGSTESICMFRHYRSMRFNSVLLTIPKNKVLKVRFRGFLPLYMFQVNINSYNTKYVQKVRCCWLGPMLTWFWTQALLTLVTTVSLCMGKTCLNAVNVATVLSLDSFENTFKPTSICPTTSSSMLR